MLLHLNRKLGWSNFAESIHYISEVGDMYSWRFYKLSEMNTDLNLNTFDGS